jgi:hypothetical protein
MNRRVKETDFDVAVNVRVPLENHPAMPDQFIADHVRGHPCLTEQRAAAQIQRYDFPGPLALSGVCGWDICGDGVF